MAHSAISVANALIERAVAAGNPLTPMQIIKLVYIAHGWMLGLYGRSLVKEPIKAWKYGPVIGDLYGSLKKYGSGHVTEQLTTIEACFDEFEEDLINQVFQKYGHLSGIDLSRLTHADGTPWDVTWDIGGQNSVIPTDLIENHYQNMARRAS